jgi:hypothetical protein
MRRAHLAWLAVSLAAGLMSAAAVAWAFAEEPLTFRDPFTRGLTDEETNTIHDDLSFVLATAAGFAFTDAARIEIWNQLVDSEQLGPAEVISYTNCSGSFHEPPNRAAVCAARPVSLTAQIWPAADSMKDPEHCFTSRFGVYSPFFHFPRLDGWEMRHLRDWAWGITGTLTGYEAYAWGTPADLTVLRANCRYTRTAVITTGLQAGSLEAFAIYLHSLADAYSHLDCIAAMDALGLEWATHTLTGVPACNYNPSNPVNTDVHGREYYTYPDSLRTDAAIRHVYAELAARSLSREGQFVPLTLGVKLAGLAATPTLSEALAAFVHTWQFTEAQHRRDHADAMVLALQGLPRQAIRRAFAPVIVR